MRSFAVASALIAAVWAQTDGYHSLNRPDMFEEVPACSTFEIKWTPNTDYTGPVTFELIGGASQATLVPIGSMFGSVDGSVGSFSWDVPCDEGDKALYGLKIFQELDTTIFQYSMPFHIVSDGSASGTGSESTASETETASETATESEVETETPEPTTYSANTTMTTMTSTSSNSTIVTHTPTAVTATSTNLVTEVPSATATDASQPSTAGASRIGGSIALVAAAAAFFAL